MRALLIEDDVAVTGALTKFLEADGFSVFSTDEGEEGLDLAKRYGYDVVVLDLGLPDMRGDEVLRHLRNARCNTPVVILSGTNDPMTKARLISEGADDYVSKPFNKDEMVARLRSVIRRANGHSNSIIEIGGGAFLMDLSHKTVRHAASGETIHFTAKEYQMFELLALRQGTTLTKEMFLNHLYKGMDEPEIKIIDVFVCKVRKKLADINKGEHYIQTIWGRGYAIAPPPPVVDARIEDLAAVA